jgi:hypothetical protein
MDFNGATSAIHRTTLYTLYIFSHWIFRTFNEACVHHDIPSMRSVKRNPIKVVFISAFFANYGRYMLWTAKLLAFYPTSMRIVLVKFVQNQRKHTNGRVVAIRGIRHFLDSKPYGPLHLHSHVILTILKLSLPPNSHKKLVRKKLNQIDLKSYVG